MVTYASIKGKNIPVGVLAKQKEAETEDIAMPFEDIGRDVNVVYPIEIGKKFKGFTFLVMVLWLSITNLQTMEALKMTIALVKST